MQKISTIKEFPKKLEIILKTVERCNIDCTYCYFFNGADKSYLKHPKYISTDTIKEIAKFLNEGCLACHYQKLQIDFHGGEPMMQRKQEFDAMCAYFKAHIDPSIELNFSIQTNATLVTPEWIDLFQKYQVSVGVSIDGPKSINDAARVDHQGQGTYDRVAAGIRQLNEAVAQGKINEIGALCVINPLYPAKTIYRHFVDELGITRMDFLLPDFTHDNILQHTLETGLTPNHYGQYLCDVFDEWTSDDNPRIGVRILKSALAMLMGRSSGLLNFGPNSDWLDAFAIASNGDLSPDDTLRSASPAMMDTKRNARNTTLKDFLDLEIFKTLRQSQKKLPNQCQACVWERVCGGGFPVHRYRSDNIFDNPSVMCESLMLFYKKVSDYLLSQGYPLAKLEQVLVA